jgi:hypothetical protein
MDQRHQGEHLERRPRLAMGHHGIEEVRLRKPGGLRQCHDVAIGRIDAGQGSRRLGIQVRSSRVVGHDGRLGLLLRLEVDRRVDLEAAVLDAIQAQPLDELVLDVVEDVRLATP